MYFESIFFFAKNGMKKWNLVKKGVYIKVMINTILKGYGEFPNDICMQNNWRVLMVKHV